MTIDEVRAGAKKLIKLLNTAGHEAGIRNAPQGYIDLYVNGERSCTYVRLCPSGKKPAGSDSRAIEAPNWVTMQAMAIAELSKLFQEEVQERFLL